MEVVISKLNDILTEINKLKPENGFRKFVGIINRAQAIAPHAFPFNSKHGGTLSSILKRFDTVFKKLSETDIHDLANAIQIMIDELEIEQYQGTNSGMKNRKTKLSDDVDNKKDKNYNSKIFVVHGHNELMKQETARILEKLKLQPIILHEQVNSGDTVIEKFVKHADVGFAVVLLSADDYGYTKGESNAKAKLRARQNVILELGYFMGKLGRDKVVAIFEQGTNFEKPSDINGVVYISYTPNEKGWQLELAKEIKAAGYQIDVNML